MINNSLWESYSGLKSYYEIGIERDQLFSQYNVIDRAKNKACAVFILNHFEYGGKDKVLHNHIADRYLNRTMDSMRLTHTASLYCLGLSLQMLFQGRMEKSLRSYIRELDQWYDPDYEFKYFWFLTCLFHDAASDIEKLEHGRPNNNISKECVEQLLKKQMNKRYGRLHRFSEETVWNYFLYRMKRGEQDHGIIAGAYLFDGLLASYNYNKKRGTRIDSSTYVVKTQYGGEDRILQVHKNHPQVFSYIADAITSHNMWTAKKENANEEYNNELKELIITDKQRLSAEDLPLHFMLCLLDTIEPTKRFSDVPAGKLLQSISICSIENGLRVAWKKDMMNHAGFYDWMKSIQGMQNWMAVCVSSCHCEDAICSVEISFN